jgi:hypothetical protein
MPDTLEVFEEEQCEVCQGWELELDELLLCQNCRKAYDLGYERARQELGETWAGIAREAERSGFDDGYNLGRGK